MGFRDNEVRLQIAGREVEAGRGGGLVDPAEEEALRAEIARI